MSALLLFSGGQDSAIALFHCLEKYDITHLIGFSYGQRHDVELECRQNLLKNFKNKFPQQSKRLGEDKVIDIQGYGNMIDSALTKDKEIEIDQSGLPTTFVPGRNIVFLSIAAGLAYKKDIKTLVGGMCEADYSGYPDCREATLTQMEKTLYLATDTKFEIESPLMHMTKADSWQYAYEMGGKQFVDLILEYSHSCYLGIRDQRHSWGHGCGQCPACLIRSAGYEKWCSERT